MLSKTTIPNATDKLEEIEVEGTEVYCLRVPRGYDINSLKGTTIFKTEDSVQYQIEGTTTELSMKNDPNRNATLISGLGDGENCMCVPIAGEIELSAFPSLHEPKDFDYKPMTARPDVEETKDRSQLALTGMLPTPKNESSSKAKKRKSKKSEAHEAETPRKKKKKSKSSA